MLRCPNMEYCLLDDDDFYFYAGFKNPNPPKKIYVVKEEVKNFSVNVLIGWDPPDGEKYFSFNAVIVTLLDFEKSINVVKFRFVEMVMGKGYLLLIQFIRAYIV